MIILCGEVLVQRPVFIEVIIFGNIVGIGGIDGEQQSAQVFHRDVLIADFVDFDRASNRFPCVLAVGQLLEQELQRRLNLLIVWTGVNKFFELHRTPPLYNSCLQSGAGQMQTKTGNRFRHHAFMIPFRIGRVKRI